jgi:hypothetical protein
LVLESVVEYGYSPVVGVFPPREQGKEKKGSELYLAYKRGKYFLSSYSVT